MVTSRRALGFGPVRFWMSKSGREAICFSVKLTAMLGLKIKKLKIKN